MLVYTAGNPIEILRGNPVLDRDTPIAIAKKLFPSDKLEAMNDGNLSYTCPPDDELIVGYVRYFPGLVIVAAKEFGMDYPFKLP